MALPIACSLRLVMLTQKASLGVGGRDIYSQNQALGVLVRWSKLAVRVCRCAQHSQPVSAVPAASICAIHCSHGPASLPTTSLQPPISQPQEGASADWQHLSSRQCVGEAVTALAAATGGAAPGEDPVPVALRRALPGPAYMFCFPILRAVMR